MNKRDFLKRGVLAGAGAVLTYEALAEKFSEVRHIPDFTLAGDDDFWTSIRADYMHRDYINLENGYYCSLPQSLLEKYIEHVRRVNLEGTWYMRKSLENDRTAVRTKLAELAGCELGEMAFTRNATESLDLIIGGFPWKTGDEAIVAEHDYPAMLDMFTLQEKKQGIVVKKVMVPVHPQSDEEIVKVYENAITPKTRLLMVCHIINITGQILPIRKICDMAHRNNVDVMVDGAHSFGHIQHKIPELGCDYYGSSLHKWLYAPLGNGLLFVKKDKIPKIWPLFASAILPEDDIYRINHSGTRPAHCNLGILDAIDYYTMIGGERKETRLRFIQNYWTSKVRGMKRVVLNTPEAAERSCAIANVGIEGMKPSEMVTTLFDKYKIWTADIDRIGVQGCRISPNIYTSTKELDVFVNALREMSGN